MTALEELLNILKQIQEQLDKYNKENTKKVIQANENNDKQDKEINAIKKEVENIAKKLEETDKKVQEVDRKVEELRDHLDNGWQNKLKGGITADMQKFVAEMTAKNYEFMQKVMEEKMDKERKKADFWYKLILAIFGTGGIVAILLNYFL